MKSAIIIFPGSNCDRDAGDAILKFDKKPNYIWYQDQFNAQDYDLIIVPGGFSYGDYLRSGAMASCGNVMQEIKRGAEHGVKVLGICNGFQILTETGLLEGALLKNRDCKFICSNVTLRVENNQSPFTKNYTQNELVSIPIAHMDGRFFADDDCIKKLEDKQQIAFRYVNDDGQIDQTSNLNGSINNIAGIFNQNKNVLGLMPHPERAIDGNLGSIDGIKLFQGLFNN